MRRPDVSSSLGAHFEHEFRVCEPAHYVVDTRMPLVAEEEMRVVSPFFAGDIIVFGARHVTFADYVGGFEQERAPAERVARRPREDVDEHALENRPWLRVYAALTTDSAGSTAAKASDDGAPPETGTLPEEEVLAVLAALEA